MGKLIFVTGGARSGKSSFAEGLAGDLGEKILYVATSIPFDDEMKDRVRRHRERRPGSWKTLEAPRDVGSRVSAEAEGFDGVLIDCVTVMIANIMLDMYEDWDGLGAAEINRVEARVKKEIDGLVSVISDLLVPVIAVSNEVGSGVVPEYPSGRAFRDYAGRANQTLARCAGEVYLCVSGIPVKIK